MWEKEMVIEESWKIMRRRPKRKWLDNMMCDEPKYMVLYVDVGAIPRHLVSN